MFVKGTYLCFKQMILSWTFGLNIINPLRLFYQYDQNVLKICSVFPELQPNIQLFDKSFNFVGPCIIEKVRNFNPIDDRLKSIFDQIDSDEGFKYLKSID